MEARCIRDHRPREAVDLSNKTSVLALVRSLKHRRERERTGLFFLEGVKMVSEAIALGARVHALVLAPEIHPRLDALPARWANLAPVIDVSKRQYQSAAADFALKQGPQGIGALVRQQWVTVRDFVIPSSGFAVALSSVQDAGNLGTILRTCDAVGCSGVVLMGECADPYGPATVRASVGSVPTQRFVRTTLEGLRLLASRTGAAIIGTSPRASTCYRSASYRRPFVLLMGNEATGLSDGEIALCDRVVSIPMAGRRDSMNVAIAAAIVMFEVFSQAAPRHSPPLHSPQESR